MTGVETSTMIYVNNISTGAASGQAANIDAVGFYYFDGSEWQKLGAGGTDTSIYQNNGTLSANRIVTMSDKTLSFNSTATAGTSHFNVDGSTFNVDAVNNRVGIGTGTPSSKLEINSGTSNTSGLKFSNLNSSTPLSSGATLGVDANGNVVTVPGSAFVPAYGRQVLTGGTQIIPANTSNYNLMSITLPTAGTYLINYHIRGEIQVTGGGGYLVGFLSTAPSSGNIVPGTEILIITTTDASRQVIGGTGAGSLVVTVTGPTTYYAGIRSAGLQGVVFDNADGSTFATYVKVTP